MRKYVAVLLVLVMALAMLPVATSGAQGMDINCMTEETTTVTVAAGAVGQELELAQAAAQRFMDACPNITVTILETPDLATDRLGLYLQLFEAQDATVDVYQIDVIWPGDLAEHLIDLTPYMTQDEIDAHFPAIIENNTVDGKLLAIPWFTDAGLLYYRTDLLEKYGFDAPPATWDELTSMAQTIQDGERADGNAEFWGYVWQGNAYEGLTCDALEWQYSASGTRIIAPDGTVEVNNDATAAAFEQAASWVGSISPDGVTGYGEEDARGVWQSGNAAFMRNWPYAYSLGQADDSPIQDLFDVEPLPAGAADLRAATLGGWQLAVSKYSEHPDAAAAVAVYMTGYDEQKTRAIEGSLNPTIQSLYEDPDVLAATPFFGSLYDVFTNAVARPSTVSSPHYNEVSTMYFTAVHSILTGDQDAAVALDLLELDLNDLMSGM